MSCSKVRDQILKNNETIETCFPGKSRKIKQRFKGLQMAPAFLEASHDTLQNSLFQKC